MDVPLGILFGILAMFAWGTADFIAAKAVKKTSVLRTVVWSQFIGVLLFSIIFFSFFQMPAISLLVGSIIVMVGALAAAVFISFYKGLQIGPVSVVSPIVSCWVVVTVLLSVIFLGESLTLLQTSGIALAILGAILASFRWQDLKGLKLGRNLKGVNYAIIALFGWGIAFALLSFVVREVGWFVPIFLQRGVLVATLVVYGVTAKQKIAFPKIAALFIALIAILETTAFMSYGLGINSNYTSLVAPVAAAFPAVTVILARIFFKEHLDWNQWLGIVSILMGIILLSVY